MFVTTGLKTLKQYRKKMKKIKIIEHPSELKKENLRIFSKGYDYTNSVASNHHINPNEVDEIILTKPSSISTEIYKIKPDLNILFFSKGDLMAAVMPVDNLPTILKNEKMFSKISKYKQKKLCWTFCRAVCSSRVKIISRMNETRNIIEVKKILERMRIQNKKLNKNLPREKLMGIEGSIAKDFYGCLKIFNKEFNDTFKKRDKDSSDIVNSLMNFGHTVLRNKIKYRLFANGISPYHSFLHNNNRDQEFLTFDFAEFWIAYVDKLIFYSLEKGIIKYKHGRLSVSTKKNIIKLINDRISEKQIDCKIKEFKEYLNGNGNFRWK